MTSNLGSEEIADHALGLREEAEAVAMLRYGNTGAGDGKTGATDDTPNTDDVKLDRRFVSLMVKQTSL